MTTRPTDEEIRARFAQLLAQRTNTSSTCHIDPMRLKELRDMWLAERQAARDGVTGEIVESIVELACRFKNDEIESVDDLYPLVRAALQSVAQPAVPDGWVKHLSAPITMEELRRAWNMIGQAHPQKEWVERALTDFIEKRLCAAPAYNGKKEG